MSAAASVVVVVAAGDPLAGLRDRLAASDGARGVTLPPGGPVLEALEEHAADLIVLDFESLGASGRELVTAARERWPDLPLIVIAQVGGTQDIAAILMTGATDVVASGSESELLLAIQKALVQVKWSKALPPPPLAIGELMLGRSKAMQAVGRELQQIGPSTATVLVRGESGTGKELVARALHRLSPRADKPFIKIDCASLPEALLESELFGYEKGAFTGAAGRKLGRVEVAQGGVLFLDEAGELSLPTQAKLLRLLQDREIDRLGGTKVIPVDVRVIAATHRDLEGMVDRGQFRQDLFYRLNVVPVWLPPLRARRDDIEELATHFCSQAAHRNQCPGVRMDADAIRLLSAQRWPGNVRQLQNFIERLVVLCRGSVVSEADVRSELERPVQFATETGAPDQDPGVRRPRPEEDACQHLSQVVRDAELQALARALDHAGGNRSLAARLLGVSRSTFYAKLKEYGLD
ncbi:MAG TPA: sigma-54 dependent transcriptional regulator [Polyangiaceae bacterium]|nr:sigma-54 dependent transcriptional regulator [Polyangiaceae bacterium]